MRNSPETKALKSWSCKPVDAKVVSRLAARGCTDTGIAARCGVLTDTIARNFAEILIKNREGLKQTLREKQIQIAKRGNVTMLIWLGKQMLEQRDKQEIIQQTDPLQELLDEFKEEHKRAGDMPPLPGAPPHA